MSDHSVIWIKKPVARPLSSDKRNAIIDAAIKAIAGNGVGASTSLISRRAGVSDGSLFVYFATKELLLNEVYLAVKFDLGESILSGYPRNEHLVRRCRHLWDRYIAWGLQYPEKKSALRQLSVSSKISAATRREGFIPFIEVDEMLKEVAASGSLDSVKSTGFAADLFTTVADMTVDQIEKFPSKSQGLAVAGFEFFWKGAVT